MLFLSHIIFYIVLYVYIAKDLHIFLQFKTIIKVSTSIFLYLYYIFLYINIKSEII